MPDIARRVGGMGRGMTRAGRGDCIGSRTRGRGWRGRPGASPVRQRRRRRFEACGSPQPVLLG
ncbi:Hypothetical protein AA314_07527 [Archangium gephyra]|uniref:Uncharacterized protein n=1 Tax=Archangium gephyra TaxID=48 RepID=A0AAC8QEZ3_9BACT|nr:Hypothetical protein AA314_07527 [Archangium gephyra]